MSILSDMERYTLQLVADNPEEDYRGIGVLCSKSMGTIQSHVKNALKKLGVKTKQGAITSA